MKMFWRNVLAIITFNIGIFMLIIAFNYMPVGYSILTFLYGAAIIILSLIELGINFGLE